MRYSQPFATPTPPLGTYPRYVNGDPVTGTEGSIPPATAFDETQIEIVNVISNVGLTPDHNDLTQLWQAIQSLIGQKYITTPITKRVHGAGADFVDINAALSWLGQYIITPSGYVTFYVAAGRWTYTVPVEINHPNANRVAIQGGALLGGSPTGGDIGSDSTSNIIFLRSVYATELSFTGGIAGFRIFRVGPTLRYLLITGSQSVSGGNWWDGRGIDVFQELIIDGIAIWGFGSTGISINNAIVYMFSSLSAVICNCNGAGSGAVLHILGGAWYSQFQSETIVVGSPCVGIMMQGGWMWCDSCTVKSHSSGGVVLYAGACLAWNNAMVSYNGGAGVYIAGNSTFLGERSDYIYNVYGLIMDGGHAWVCASGIYWNNSGWDLVVGGGSYCNAIGAGIGQMTPAPNVANAVAAVIQY